MAAAAAVVALTAACVAEREAAAPITGPAGPAPAAASAPPPPSTSDGPGPTTPPGPTTGPPRSGGWRYVYPVAGRTSYGRTHSGYRATDIFAPCGATVRAVVDGEVLEVSRVDRYDPAHDDGAERGGLFVSLLGDDGVRYYGSHLRTVRAGIEAGVRVRAGQALGVVGDTGRASACHLHFGVSPPCARTGDWWVRRGVVWPWSYLDSWRAGGRASPVRAVAAWRSANGCPTSP
jgi:murein DD-endopeptidase MepM/ murein hydrolase activator NlpD